MTMMDGKADPEMVELDWWSEHVFFFSSMSHICVLDRKQRGELGRGEQKAF